MRLPCVLFVLFVLPLQAQNSVENSATVAPSASPTAATINPDPELTSKTISTGDLLPSRPLLAPKLSTFVVTPSTLRENFAYPQRPHIVATLDRPATVSLTFTVSSSDSAKLTCAPITFEKGEQRQLGQLLVNWTNVHADCQVAVKIFNQDHPELSMHSRIYLRKSLQAQE